MIIDNVTGQTFVYGIIGDPVTHSFSPIIHNSITNDMLNVNMVYVPFTVKRDDLGAAVSGAGSLGIQGLNVTVPHKIGIARHLFALDPLAKQIGSINTLKLTENGYIGYNTDAIGVIMSLKRNKVELKDKIVLIIGSGGGAYAAAVAVASHFPAKIILANRTASNSEELKNQVLRSYKKTDIDICGLTDIPSISKCDIVIQTTTLGFGKLSEQNPVEDISFFKRAGVSVAFDIIYTPWRTKFLESAAVSGVETIINGFSMLIYQAIASQEIWFGAVFGDEDKEQHMQALKMYYKSMNNF